MGEIWSKSWVDDCIRVFLLPVLVGQGAQVAFAVILSCVFKTVLTTSNGVVINAATPPPIAPQMAFFAGLYELSGFNCPFKYS